jgi:protein-disulfide isomerase
MTTSWLLVAGVVAACSPSVHRQPSQGSDPAAQIGERTVTLQELDDRWRADNPAQHAEVVQSMYNGRRSALEGILADALLADAAKRRGLSTDAFEEVELTQRSAPVTDADITTFYQSNLSQMQGRSLEEMAPLIRDYLQEQRHAGARQALLAELRSAGPPVRVMLDAPRHEVVVDASDPALGSSSAAVTLVEFSDFQCPFCQRVAPTLKRVVDTYGDRVRVVWKDFPLTQIHPQAFMAAEAAHCAGDGGRYWEYHDLLFANQQALQPDDLRRYARELGLDVAAFDACLSSSRHTERVRNGIAQGTRLGVNSTPTVYVNGRLLSGAQPYEIFAAVIDEELSRLGQSE